jgi:hypothetical protein
MMFSQTLALTRFACLAALRHLYRSRRKSQKSRRGAAQGTKDQVPVAGTCKISAAVGKVK